MLKLISTAGIKTLTVFLTYMYKIKSVFSISPYEMALVYDNLVFNNYNVFLYD